MDDLYTICRRSIQNLYTICGRFKCYLRLIYTNYGQLNRWPITENFPLFLSKSWKFNKIGHRYIKIYELFSNNLMLISVKSVEDTQNRSTTDEWFLHLPPTKWTHNWFTRQILADYTESLQINVDFV